jgi:hypothetical protein
MWVGGFEKSFGKAHCSQQLVGGESAGALELADFVSDCQRTVTAMFRLEFLVLGYIGIRTLTQKYRHQELHRKIILNNQALLPHRRKHHPFPNLLNLGGNKKE